MRFIPVFLTGACIFLSYLFPPLTLPLPRGHNRSDEKSRIHAWAEDSAIVRKVCQCDECCCFLLFFPSHCALRTVRSKRPNGKLFSSRPFSRILFGRPMKTFKNSTIPDPLRWLAMTRHGVSECTHNICILYIYIYIISFVYLKYSALSEKRLRGHRVQVQALLTLGLPVTTCIT